MGRRLVRPPRAREVGRGGRRLTSAPDLATSRDPDEIIAGLDRATAQLLADPHRHGSAVRLPARGRLIATGDLHDNPLHLAKVIRYARLEAADDHHVVVHELIHGDRLVNGMDFSHRMLVRTADLVVRHPGQVHPVLANHELAQLTRRGVSKGAGNNVTLFDDAVDFVFGERADDVTAALGRFIRAFPLAVLSEGGVACAHSLPNAGAMRSFDMGVLDRPLVEEDYQGPLGAAYLMTWGREHTDEQVDRLAEAWNVELFCLGHQHVETGIEMRGRRIIVLNTDHERATVLALDLADVPTAEAALMQAMPLVGIA